MDPELREYLEVLHRLMEAELRAREGGRWLGWGMRFAANSLEAVLKVNHLDLAAETEFLRKRLGEVERAQTADVTRQDSWREVKS